MAQKINHAANYKPVCRGVSINEALREFRLETINVIIGIPHRKDYYVVWLREYPTLKEMITLNEDHCIHKAHTFKTILN
jgi:hypothetical protein